MDKRPKRSRDKYNPYTLHSEKAKNIYRVTFSNQNKTINIAITKEIFDELDENENIKPIDLDTEQELFDFIDNKRSVIIRGIVKQGRHCWQRGYLDISGMLGKNHC